MLYSAVEQAPSAELVEPEFLTRYFATFDEEFFHYCDKELTKINTFYSGICEMLDNEIIRRKPKTNIFIHFICRKTCRGNEKICKSTS